MLKIAGLVIGVILWLVGVLIKYPGIIALGQLLTVIFLAIQCFIAIRALFDLRKMKTGTCILVTRDWYYCNDMNELFKHIDFIGCFRNYNFVAMVKNIKPDIIFYDGSCKTRDAEIDDGHSFSIFYKPLKSECNGIPLRPSSSVMTYNLLYKWFKPKPLKTNKTMTHA